VCRPQTSVQPFTVINWEAAMTAVTEAKTSSEARFTASEVAPEGKARDNAQTAERCQGAGHFRTMVVDLNVSDRAARHASRKAAWRLIPFLILCFLIAFLDRVNVGFAALTMNKELGLTAEMFGFGVGIFFLGYFVFEVPSNLILERVSARRWIARIMISWGIISVSFAFVPSISTILQGFGFSFFDNARTFYLLRVIFDAAEAGFFPGIILYLTYWFTADERARWFGVFITGNPLSSVIGGPIPGFYSRHDSTAQWALADGNGCSLSRACRLSSSGYGL
jgi:sugar phosphate permease